jgi:hypothetical protein
VTPDGAFHVSVEPVHVKVVEVHLGVDAEPPDQKMLPYCVTTPTAVAPDATVAVAEEPGAMDKESVCVEVDPEEVISAYLVTRVPGPVSLISNAPEDDVYVTLADSFALLVCIWVTVLEAMM